MQTLKPKPKYGWYGQITYNPCQEALHNTYTTPDGDEIGIGSRVYHVLLPSVLGTIVSGPRKGRIELCFGVTWDKYPYSPDMTHICSTLRKAS